MKFLKHLFPGKKVSNSGSISRVITGRANSCPVPQPRSFGEKRAHKMNSALNKAMRDRKDLIRKQFASPDPLRTVFKQQGHRLDAQIRRIKDQKK